MKYRFIDDIKDDRWVVRDKWSACKLCSSAVVVNRLHGAVDDVSRTARETVNEARIIVSVGVSKLR